MGLNLFCKSTVYQVLMQTFKGFYDCTKNNLPIWWAGLVLGMKFTHRFYWLYT